MSRLRTSAVFAVAIFFGATWMVRHGDAIEKENNAFAKDCNDRGGMVVFGMHARQCIGADPAKHNKEK